MSLTQLRAVLADVVAIPVTPFDESGALDRGAYRGLLRRMVEAGVRVVTPNGNTGEFYSLTPDERRQLVEETVAVVGADASEDGRTPADTGGRCLVMAGVGLDVGSAVAAARHAQEAGAEMVMVHQPVNPYVAAEGWVDYNRAIADAVPELGVICYVRNPLVGGEQIARLGELSPNVIGMKYAVPDAARFAAVARDAGLERFCWINGLAELYAPAYWAMGASGFTSGLVNVTPELSLSLRDALRAGDYPVAMKVWEQIRAFEELRAVDQSAHNVTVVKEALAGLGLCRREVRPPCRLLTEPERSAVAAAIATWGLTKP